MQEPATPLEVATAATAAFLTRELAPASRLLEIGCGSGEVAVALARAGHQVLAIDGDPDRVAAARRLGVDARQAAWPGFGEHAATHRFDAIAFTRSLHHVAPLARALAVAHARLEPGGLLLIEDFAFETIDGAAVGWLLAQARAAASRRLLQPVAGELVTTLLAAGDPLAACRAAHDHELHPFHAIAAEVAARFDVVRSTAAPYLFRYLITVLPATPSAAAFVAAAAAAEIAAASRGELPAVGRRLVALATPGGAESG